jgi:hypothetical protein
MVLPSSEVAVRCLRLQATIKSASSVDKGSKELFDAWRNACVFLQKQLPLLKKLEKGECNALLQTLSLCLQCSAKLGKTHELAAFQQAALAYQVLRQLYTEKLFEHILSLGILVLEFLLEHRDTLPSDKAETLRSGTLVALGAALSQYEAVPSTFLHLSRICLAGLDSFAANDSQFVQRLVFARTKATACPLERSHLQAALNLLCHGFEANSQAMLSLLPLLAKASSTTAAIAFCEARDPTPTPALHAALLPHMLAALARSTEEMVETPQSKQFAVTADCFRSESLRIHHCLWRCIKTGGKSEESQDATCMQLDNMDSIISKLRSDNSQVLTSVLTSCAAAIESAAKDPRTIRSPQSLLPGLKAVARCAFERLHQPEGADSRVHPAEILAAGAALASAFASVSGAVAPSEDVSCAHVFAAAAQEVLQFALAGDLDLFEDAVATSVSVSALVSALRYAPSAGKTKKNARLHQGNMQADASANALRNARILRHSIPVCRPIRSVSVNA